jgi:dTDP-4-amino-4,6-dideoxygalactose transaminase
MTRWLPPVHSPVSWRAVRAAWGAALGVDALSAVPSLTSALRATYEADGALLTDSGTSALALAIAAALADTPGASVALPAYCCYDIATAADAADVPVMLYDVDPDTLAPRWESLEVALGAGARAVVVAHLYGYPVDVPRALALARGAGAVVIEDAAQSAGARLAGRPAGTLGPLTVLSFGRGKGITGGAGGALLGRGTGSDLVERARRRVTTAASPWRPLLALTAQRLLAHPAVYGLPASLPWLKLGQTLYHQPSPPRGMSAAAAVAARQALTFAENETAIRRRHAAALEDAARAGRVLRIVRAIPTGEPGYLRLAGRLAARGVLPPHARRLGIMPGYPLALADLAGFRPRVRGQSVVDGARELAACLVTLPTHSLLRGGDLADLEAWLRG